MSTNIPPARNHISDYALTLRWRWGWVVLPVVLCALVATLLATRQVASFQATARVLLGETAAQEAVIGSGIGNSGIRDRLLANEVSLAESDQVRAEVRTQLGLTPDQVLPRGRVVTSSGSDVLEFTFTANSPERSAEIANTWAQAYVSIRRDAAVDSIDEILVELEGQIAELQSSRLSLRSDLDDLLALQTRTADPEQRQQLEVQIESESAAIAGDVAVIDAQVQASIADITQLRLARELGSGSAEVVRAAVPANETPTGALVRNLAVGITIGLIIGVGLAFLVDNLWRTVRVPFDVERLGLDVIGRLPRASRRFARSNQLDLITTGVPTSAMANEFQRIRSAVQVAMTREGLGSVLITSSRQGEGKSFVASNLALAMATVHNQVDLADIDLRNPRLHNVFGRASVPGLTDVAIKDVDLADALLAVPGLPESLRVLPAGTSPPNPAPFVSSPPCADLIVRLRTGADLAVFDSPPTLLFADALALASQVDAVILVARAGKTRPDDLQFANDSIVRSGGKVLGVILNGDRVEKRQGRY